MRSQMREIFLYGVWKPIGLSGATGAYFQGTHTRTLSRLSPICLFSRGEIGRDTSHFHRRFPGGGSNLKTAIWLRPSPQKNGKFFVGGGQKLTKTDDFVYGRFLYGRIMRQLLVDLYPYLPIGHSIDVSLLPTKGIVAKKLIRLGEGPRFPCKHLPLLTKLLYGTFTVLFSSL